MYQPELEHHFEDLDKQRHAAQLGMWIFLASELLLFAALFTLYFAYRAHFPEVFHDGVGHNPRHLGTLNTCILLLGSLTAALGVNALRRNRTGAARLLVGCTALTALGFLAVKIYEYGLHFKEGILPGGAGDFFAAHPEPGWPVFFTLYYAMTGLHAIHVTLGGLLFAFIAWWIGRARVGAAGAYRAELGALYWHFVDVVWVFLWPMFYLLGAHG